MTTTPTFGVSVSRTNKRIATLRGNQTHRGWQAWVRLPGVRTPYPCGHLHSKPGSAKECGAALGRHLTEVATLAPGVDGSKFWVSRYRTASTGPDGKYVSVWRWQYKIDGQPRVQNLSSKREAYALAIADLTGDVEAGIR